MSGLELLHDGSPDAPVSVLLAAGAGADCRSPFVAEAALGLARRGLHVVRFDFPYMQRTNGEPPSKRAPDRMPVLLDAMRAAIRESGIPRERLVLAGKSMGSRVAAALCDEQGSRGVIAFGFPFHPPRKPDQLRTAVLQALRAEALLLQGERDPFGQPHEVATYDLPSHVRVEWFADGDHSLVPRAKSGHSAAAHFDRALDLAAAFALRVAGGSGPRSALR